MIMIMEQRKGGVNGTRNILEDKRPYGTLRDWLIPSDFG